MFYGIRGKQAPIPSTFTKLVAKKGFPVAPKIATAVAKGVGFVVSLPIIQDLTHFYLGRPYDLGGSRRIYYREFLLYPTRWQTEDARDAATAVRELGKCGSLGISVIEEVLDPESAPLLKEIVAKELSTCNACAIPFLGKMLAQEGFYIGRAFALALGRTRSRAAIPFLKEKVTNGANFHDPELMSGIVIALAKIGATEELSFMRDIRDQVSVATRAGAARIDREALALMDEAIARLAA